MSKAIFILCLALVISGCEKKEPKPDIVTATEEETAVSLQGATPSTNAPEKKITTHLPPMVSPKPLDSQAVAQYLPQAKQVERAFKTFRVYSDKDSSDNHFIPSGWMGDSADITLTTDSMDSPYSGSTCIKITYRNKASNGARWAGIYWQDPPGNWGLNSTGGYDLTGAKKITFWARGERGGERIEEFKMGGISGAYPDSDTAGIGPVVLTKQWKQYTINLSGKNLSHVIGGFAWSSNIDVNPDGATFYLDDIAYE